MLTDSTPTEARRIRVARGCNRSQIPRQRRARVGSTRWIFPSAPDLLTGRGVGSAAVDPNLSKALWLIGQYPRTFVSLYKIFELSQQLPQHEAWSSMKQRKRFTHSANSPGVHGDDARHAATRIQPPSNPMSPKDAEAFYRGHPVSVGTPFRIRDLVIWYVWASMRLDLGG